MIVHKKTYSRRIEARIGNSYIPNSFGVKQITANKKCGITSSTSSSYVETFTCLPALDGRYISLQSLYNAGLGVSELSVFTVGELRIDVSRQVHTCSRPRDFVSQAILTRW